MSDHKPIAGKKFPSMVVPTLVGADVDLSAPATPGGWRLVVVYRGKHCPICTRYLKELNSVVPDLAALGVDLVAVSADPLAKAQAHLADVKPDYHVAYGLSVDQMQTLGLYISEPRSEAETDRPFAEPGLFLVNADGKLQFVAIANAPFARPDLASLVQGIGFIKDPANDYPIRGTFPVS